MIRYYGIPVIIDSMEKDNIMPFPWNYRATHAGINI